MWIISFLAAIVLWTYVVSEQNPKISDNITKIPVKLMNVETLEGKGLVISDPQEYTVDIRVYGRRNQLYKIQRSQLDIQADLSQLDSKGTHHVPITVAGLPDDVEINNKNPDSIKITLDQIVQQERNIKVNITGKPADGMAYLSYVANPSKVTIEGPEKLLNNIRDVVALIDITNKNQEVTQSLPLKALDSDGREVSNVTISPSTVDVTIPIGPTKTVDVNSEIIGNLPNGFVITNVENTPAKILIGATTQQLKDIEAIATEKINVSGYSRSFEKKVKLLLPQGVEVINGEAAIIVKITIEPIINREFDIETLNVINLKEELTIQEDLMNLPIKLTLRGPKTQIESLKDGDVVINLDAKNLQEGQHNITLKADVPEGITVESIEPAVVKVHIQGQAE